MGKKNGKVAPQFYTWEQNYKNTGHTFVVGTLDEIGLEAGEPRFEEEGSKSEYSECKWHKDFTAVEAYLKSFPDYEALVKDNRIAYNDGALEKNTAEFYADKGWVYLTDLNQDTPSQPAPKRDDSRDKQAEEISKDIKQPDADSPKKDNHDASDDA